MRITAERNKALYRPGMRVELIQMGDDPRPVEPGTRGTVTYVDDAGSVGVDWDNGRSLALITEADSFRVLTQEEVMAENEDMDMKIYIRQRSQVQKSAEIMKTKQEHIPHYDMLPLLNSTAAGL